MNPIISFSSNESPNSKIAPIIVGGAALLGKAIIGGAVGGAASWGANRFLDSRFPEKK